LASSLRVITERKEIMSKFNLKLTGTLQTLSPIAIVPPGAAEIALGAGKYKQIANTIIYANELRQSRPHIPGSTLRGRLRRAAVDVCLGLAGGRIPLNEWHQNAVGGIKGSESENAYDVVARQGIREKNPILSLFGAGSPWIGSKASIGHAVPVHAIETMKVGSVRSDDGRRNDAFFEKLDDAAVDDWVALVDANAARTRLKQQKDALQKERGRFKREKNNEEMARIDAEIKALESDDEALKTLTTNPVSMPLLHEAMPLGVTLDHEIKLTAVTVEEIGLFFAGFNAFLKGNPAIGQHENMGYGLFSGVYNVQLDDLSDFDPFTVNVLAGSDIGTLGVEPHKGFTDVPEFILSAMGSFKSAYEAGQYDFSVIKTKAPAKKAKADAKADAEIEVEAAA
jgi:CRISPR type IV-associated protein Csf2